MFVVKSLKFLLFAVSVYAVFAGCTKKWDDHNLVENPAINNNLLQAVQATPSLSKFNELLIKSGYDKIISSSKTYTVWAPTDQALQNLDQSIVTDSIKLKQFVANHITNQSYLATGASQRIKMLNGKYIGAGNNRFDSAGITTANVYANNGVLHIIDKYVPRLDNLWEFVNNTAVAPAMKNFLLSLNRRVFDPSIAKQTGINPTTGEPVYDSATGSVIRNTFLDSVMNVSNETEQFTLFLLTDNEYSAEFNALTKYFVTGTTDSTNRLSGYWLVKDLVFKGAYTAAQLPDTPLVSQSGVKVLISKSAITQSYRTSNGIIHVVSQLNISLSEKFPSIVIQGENPTSFAADRNVNTFYRVRTHPVNGGVFRDILMQNYNFASYFIRYLTRNVPSLKYDAYWVAVNDVQTTPLWQQRLGIDSVTNATNLPYVTVAFRNYNEVKLGQITINRFRNLELFVIGPTTASSSGGTNSISLDYIKLVPVF